LAQVLGIMQPLMLLFSIFIQYFTKYNLDNFLIKNFLCYFTYDQNKYDKIIWRYQSYKEFKDIFKNITNNQEKNELNAIKNFSKIEDKI